MEKILTISIAAYNVAEYLKHTLESIVNNRIVPRELLEKLEVLVVDDESKDDTRKIAKEYEKRFPGIVRVINKENAGHGSTINRGICEATGKYFKALDGDDWFETAALSHILKHLSDKTADIVVTDYYKCFEGAEPVLVQVDGIQTMKEDIVLQYEEQIPNIRWIPYHAAIYRTEILQKHTIRLDEKIFYVDTEFMLYPVPYLKTIMYLSYGLYCYRLGREGQSVSKTSRIKNITHGEKVAVALLNLYKNNVDDLSDTKKRYLIRGIGGHCVWHVRSMLLMKPNKENCNKLIEFDKTVRGVSPEIYAFMDQESHLVHWLRRCNYKLYKLICFYRQHKREK